MAFLFILILWFEFLVLHEYAHARVAYAGGDTTVADKGYLTLNPFRYSNFYLTFLVPLLILVIGGIPLPGGCVYVDHSRLKRRYWESLVAAAGVAAQIAALPLLLIPFWVLEVQQDVLFWQVYACFIFLVCLSVVINLLPIPPLDGYGIIEPYLPRGIVDLGNTIKPFGLWIVLFIVWRGFAYLQAIALYILLFMKIDPRLIIAGYNAVFQ